MKTKYYPKTDADKEAMQMASQAGCFSMLPSKKQREIINRSVVVVALPKVEETAQTK